jgi:hypothetical protein
MGLANILNLTLLYINSEAVIPAPYRVRGNSGENPDHKHWIPPYQVPRVKHGAS